MNLRYRPFAVTGFIVLFALFFLMYFTDAVLPVLLGIGAILFVASLLFKNLREQMLLLYIAFALLYSSCLFVVADISGPKAVEPYLNGVHTVSGNIAEKPSYSGSRYYYIIDLEEIDGQPVSSKLRLSLSESIDVDVYDKISLNAHIYEISADSEDIQLYYYSKGIFSGAYVYSDEEVIITVTKNSSFSVNKAIMSFKDLIVNNVTDSVPGENGATLVAMLLGDKSHLTDERNDSFREAGIAPIFAVSGMHLSLWVMGLFSLLIAIGLRKRLASVIAIVFTVFFMLLTGLTPSVCRSGIMLILLLISNIFYRKTDSVNSLGFVALLLCTINPFIAVDTGFLLSFSATLGIVTIVPLLNKHIFNKLPDNVACDILKNMLNLLSVSVCASVAVLPVTVLLIGQVSLLSVITNTVLSGVAMICMVMGGLAAVFDFVPIISDAMYSVAGFLATLLLKFVDAVCSLPVTVISTENLFWKVGIMVAVGIVVVGIFNFKGKNIFKFISVALSVNIVVFSLSAYYYFSGLTQLRIIYVENGIAAVCYSNGEKIALTGKADDFMKTTKISDSLDYYSLYNNNLLLLGDVEALDDSSNFELIKNNEFKRIVLPYSSQSLESIADKDNIFPTSEAVVEIFDDNLIKYVCNEEYSLALCEFDGVSFLFLFQSDKNADIPEEYLSADYLVCCGYIPYSVQPETFKRVIICAKENKATPIYEYVISCGGNAKMIYDLDGLIINIRNNSCKFYVMEG